MPIEPDAEPEVVPFSEALSEGLKKPPEVALSWVEPEALLLDELLLPIDVSLSTDEVLVELSSDGFRLSVVLAPPVVVVVDGDVDVDGVVTPRLLLLVVPGAVTPTLVSLESGPEVTPTAAPATGAARVLQSGMHSSGLVLWIDAQCGTFGVCADAKPAAPRIAAASRVRVAGVCFMENLLRNDDETVWHPPPQAVSGVVRWDRFVGGLLRNDGVAAVGRPRNL